MGCNSEYMRQTDYEKRIQDTAKLLVYTLKSLKKPVPKFVASLANTMYASDPQDKLVPMLCKVCKSMTEKQKNAIIYNARNADSRQLANWWDEHQKADAERISLEKKYKEKLKFLHKTLNKLTDDELHVIADFIKGDFDEDIIYNDTRK